MALLATPAAWLFSHSLFVRRLMLRIQLIHLEVHGTVRTGSWKAPLLLLLYFLSSWSAPLFLLCPHSGMVVCPWRPMYLWQNRQWFLHVDVVAETCQLSLTPIFFFLGNQLESFPDSLILKCGHAFEYSQLDGSGTNVCYFLDLGP